MLSRTISLGIQGINASVIEIEVDIHRGLPNFTIVGLPDSTIRESKDRIRSAIENSGFEFPPKNFIVNLAPAGFKKQGANYDLPIAVSILHATDQTCVNPSTIPIVGELSLDGSVKPVRGVISMAIAIYNAGFQSAIIPYENRKEASAVEEIDIYPVKNITETIMVLQGEMRPYKGTSQIEATVTGTVDFSDVKGQESAKRAIEIAAAGHHNIILYGAPGSGKTMLAKRIPSILPLLKREQSIETTMIHSVGGILNPDDGLVTAPPFRSPHHTASDSALVGGGVIPSVGEVSLSHNGVLFLDEFVEFKSNVLQSLRQPLEDQIITVARASGSCQFPADFMLVAASNPCRCGFLFDREIPCSCPAHRIKDYFHKISGPILDRIDIEVLVNRVPYRDLISVTGYDNSSRMREKILTAREIQRKRFCNSATRYNSRMTSSEIKRHCTISSEAEALLELSMKRFNLTARSFFKVLKVSRTIADLNGENNIKKKHILEALSYKTLQRNYEV